MQISTLWNVYNVLLSVSRVWWLLTRQADDVSLPSITTKHVFRNSYVLAFIFRAKPNLKNCSRNQLKSTVDKHYIHMYVCKYSVENTEFPLNQLFLNLQFEFVYHYRKLMSRKRRANLNSFLMYIFSITLL